jgi:hypothetical protein
MAVCRDWQWQSSRCKQIAGTEAAQVSCDERIRSLARAIAQVESRIRAVDKQWDSPEKRALRLQLTVRKTDLQEHGSDI